MTTIIQSGSIGPFEKTKSSVFNMAMSMIEIPLIISMIENDRIEELCDYLISDPRYADNRDLPN